MTDRQLGQELGRVSGKDSLRTQEVVTEMKLRGTQIFEAAPPVNNPGNAGATTARPAVSVTGTLAYDPNNGSVLTRPSAPQVIAAPSATQQPVAAPEVARPTVKVVVVGDSFTSGEGATSSTYRTVPVPVTTEDGITYQVQQIDPAHQSSTAPTLQALNQIQAANPGADIQVTFVPVSGATRDSLYQTTNPGTPFEQAPQINAVKGADVVIVGIGGNDARFSDWVKTALGNTDSSSAQQFPEFTQQLNDGTYLANQTKLLNDISGMAAPNATIVSLGYPKALPATVPGTPTWYSPFSWSTISQGEADRSNELATTLNTNNQAASALAASQHPAQQWLYADVSTALQGHELLTNQEGLNGLTPTNLQGSYHPNDLGQQLLGSVLQPYVEQAVNNQLARLGVQGAENVPPATPTFANEWNMRVDIPLQMQSQQQNQIPGTDQVAPTQQDPPQQDPAQQNGTQPDGTPPLSSPPEGTDPNGDLDRDGISNSQDPTWNENNTDPTSTDVGDGPEGNPGYTDPAAPAPAPAPADNTTAPTNPDTGSGNFSGSLDPNAGLGATDTGATTPDTGTGYSDSGFGNNTGATGGVDTGTGFSDSGFGNNSGSIDTGSGYSDSGFGNNSGSLDTGSSYTGGTDTGSGYSDSGFGSSGGYDSGSSGSFDSGSSGGYDSGSSGSFDSGGGGFDSGGGGFDSGGGGFDSGGGF